MRHTSNLLFAAVTFGATSFLPFSSRAENPPGAPPALNDVTLTGWVHVGDYDFDDATVQVEVNGEVQTAHLSKTGRFDISLPSGTEAVLRFEHPGHLTKELLVDTRHARDGYLGRDTRHVKFAVILEQERYMGGQVYAGPVGNLGFDKNGGCLTVQHTNKLVVGRSRSRKPMVF